ncbi:MAG: hypothetical protein Q9198_001718 [Flavoplaca austrocitrina]
MITVNARILPSVRLHYQAEAVDPVRASWDIIGKKFSKAARLQKWTFVKFAKNEITSSDIHRKLQAIAENAGVSSSGPQPKNGLEKSLKFPIGPSTHQGNEEIIKQTMVEASKMGLQMLFVILPNNNAFIYSRVKFYADIRYGKRLPKLFCPLFDLARALNDHWVFETSTDLCHGCHVLQSQAPQCSLHLSDSTRDERLRILTRDPLAGIHTVCSVHKKLLEKKMDYGSNIAHKINLKLGGINQTISADTLGKFGDGRAMLVGMDVTHPSPGSLPKSPSVVGVVANTDPSFGQWPGSLRIQNHREMITNLKEMFNERLEAWFRRNDNLPERILIYRDGVSETQLQDVLEEELSQIEVACEIRYKTKTTGKYPKISMFVCGKRHHTRFYPTRIEDGDGARGQNCRNGTVVDRGVTHEHWWDFFLQAHHAIQGTAKPTRYVVIRDDNQLDANTVESFVCLHPQLKLFVLPTDSQVRTQTHHLCYLSGRSTKAISLCPPAYFADLLCERGRMYLYKVYNASQFDDATAPVDAEGNFDENRSPWLGGVHPNIKDSMFYI